MIVIYIIVVLIAALLITAFLFPKNYNVEKAISVKKIAREVMDKAGNLNFLNYGKVKQKITGCLNPGAMVMKQKFSGKTATIFLSRLHG